MSRASLYFILITVALSTLLAYPGLSWVWGSPYPWDGMGVVISLWGLQGCRENEISIPIPTGFLWEFPYGFPYGIPQEKNDSHFQWAYKIGNSHAKFGNYGSCNISAEGVCSQFTSGLPKLEPIVTSI